MDFNFRQYDPQIGRFLSVDPLADYYGQDRYSPYAAMGNQPESTIDPNGLLQTNDDLHAENFARISRIANEHWSETLNKILGPYSKMAENYRVIDIILSMKSTIFRLHFGQGSGGGSSSPQQEAAVVENKKAEGTVDGSEMIGNNPAQEGEKLEGDLGGIKVISFMRIDKNVREAFKNMDLLPEGMSDFNIGIYILLGYNDNDDLYTDLQWVQTVETNLLISPQKSSPFIDVVRQHSDIPFYQSNDNQKKKYSNTGGYSSIFVDLPNRLAISPFYTYVNWQAELSLVGKINGKYTTITTITYGFQVNGWNLTLFDPRLKMPSEFHQKVLNSIQ